MMQRMKSGLSLEAAAHKPLGAYGGQRTARPVLPTALPVHQRRREDISAGQGKNASTTSRQSHVQLTLDLFDEPVSRPDLES